MKRQSLWKFQECCNSALHIPQWNLSIQTLWPYFLVGGIDLFFLNGSPTSVHNFSLIGIADLATISVKAL